MGNLAINIQKTFLWIRRESNPRPNIVFEIYLHSVGGFGGTANQHDYEHISTTASYYTGTDTSGISRPAVLREDEILLQGLDGREER